MKIKKSFSLRPVPTEIVAKFGRVRLIRKSDGRHELIGGNTDQREAARQWCNQHATFVTFAHPTSPALAIAA